MINLKVNEILNIPITGGRLYLLSLFERLVRGLTWRTAQVAQLALIIVMAITVTNVIIRIPYRPIGGAVELVEMSGAVLLGLGVAYTALMKGHIMVGLLVDKFSPRVQGLIDLVVSGIALIFSYILAREILFFAYNRMMAGYYTGHLEVPIAPSIYLVAFGIIMFAMVILLDLIKAVRTVAQGSDSQ